MVETLLFLMFRICIPIRVDSSQFKFKNRIGFFLSLTDKKTRNLSPHREKILPHREKFLLYREKFLPHRQKFLSHRQKFSLTEKILPHRENFSLTDKNSPSPRKFSLSPTKKTMKKIFLRKREQDEIPFLNGGFYWSFETLKKT